MENELGGRFTVPLTLVPRRRAVNWLLHTKRARSPRAAQEPSGASKNDPGRGTGVIVGALLVDGAAGGQRRVELQHQAAALASLKR
jgi:hypothetical protein